MLASISIRCRMSGASALVSTSRTSCSPMITSSPIALLAIKYQQPQALKFSSFSGKLWRSTNEWWRSSIVPASRRFSTETATPEAEAANETALESPIIELPRTPEQQELEAAMRDPSPKFAVVYVGGHQYKVTSGDLILVTKMDAPVGSRIALKKVLLAGSQRATAIGMPLVPQARVEALVEQHVLTDKLYVFKKRRRKNSQRTRGVRHPVTQLRIMKIDVAAEDM